MVGAMKPVGGTAGTTSLPAFGGSAVTAHSLQAGFAVTSPEFIAFARQQGAMSSPPRGFAASIRRFAPTLRLGAVPSFVAPLKSALKEMSVSLVASALGSTAGICLSNALVYQKLSMLDEVATMLLVVGGVAAVAAGFVMCMVKNQPISFAAFLLSGLAAGIGAAWGLGAALPVAGVMLVASSLMTAGSSLRHNWRTFRALTQLQAASQDTALRQRFFAEHPECYIQFLQGPTRQTLLDEKTVVETQIRQLYAQIDKWETDIRNPAMDRVAPSVSAPVLATLKSEIAENRAAIAKLGALHTLIEAKLARLPAFVEQIEASIHHCNDLKTVAKIAEKAEMSGDAEAAAERSIAEAQARLAGIIEEVAASLDDIGSHLAANAEVTTLTMPGTDPLAAEIATLGTEVVERAPAGVAVEVVEAGAVEVAAAR